jgi:hypothetical protein
MGDKTNIKNLFENIRRNISAGRTRQRRQDDIKMSLKEIYVRISAEFNWLMHW